MNKALNSSNLRFILLLLILLSNFNSFILLFGIVVFGGILLLLNFTKSNLDERIIFYFGLALMAATQFLFIYTSDYGKNFIINTSIALLLSCLALLCYLIVKSSVLNMNETFIKKLLNTFFLLNIVAIALQYLWACYQTSSLVPFMVSIPSFGMSTGDHLKGLFVNSSVTMVVMGFYTIYYGVNKNKKVFIAAIAMLLTTYMSGILMFFAVLALFAFFTFSFKNKIKVLIGFLVLFGLLKTFSPHNLSYAEQIIFEKISSRTDPARKVISYQQTLENWVSSPKSFLVGEGAGKFSSRAAFITGGEYVDWFPNELVYKSQKFDENHFELWNNRILSIRYKDGTHNQPFSFYNQIIGEFGLTGLLLFALYLFYYIKKWNTLTYGKIILPFMLGVFIYDYWFDYFSIIIFFELFMNLNLKRREVQ